MFFGWRLPEFRPPDNEPAQKAMLLTFLVFVAFYCFSQQMHFVF